MNRRIVFFAIAAVVCFALIPLLSGKNADFRWVPRTVGLIYVALTLLSAADLIGRRRL